MNHLKTNRNVKKIVNNIIAFTVIISFILTNTTYGMPSNYRQDTLRELRLRNTQKPLGDFAEALTTKTSPTGAMGMREEDIQPLVDLLSKLGVENMLKLLAEASKLTKEQAEKSSNPFAKIAYDPGLKRMMLGWIPDRIKELIDNPDLVQKEIIDYAKAIKVLGFESFLFTGIGGSGLGGATIVNTYGQPEDGKVYILTTPSRDQQAAAIEDLKRRYGGDLKKALQKLVIFAISKSGNTSETKEQVEFFKALFKAYGINSTTHIIFVTDPDTKDRPTSGDKANYFAQMIAEGYEWISIQVDGNNDDGGRFTSPTTKIALLPLALIDPDLVMPYLQNAYNMTKAGSYFRDELSDQSALELYIQDFVTLGAFIDMMTKKTPRAYNKLTLLMPEELKAFSPWLVQLMHESLGKNGKGVELIYGEELTPEMADDFHRQGRIFLRVNLKDKPGTEQALWDAVQKSNVPTFEIEVKGKEDLGGLQAGFQLTTATIALLSKIPFVIQPAVEGHKDATRAVMKTVKEGEPLRLPEITTDGDSRIGSRSGKLSLYFDSLFKAGILKYEDIKKQVEEFNGKNVDRQLAAGLPGIIKAGRGRMDVRLLNMNNPAAVYAAIYKLIKESDRFEQTQLGLFGTMSERTEEAFARIRKSFFTDNGVPSLLSTWPDDLHANEQDMADGLGRKITFTTAVYPTQAATIPGGDAINIEMQNQLSAPFIGLQNSKVNFKGMIVGLAYDGNQKETATALENFFDEVSEILGEDVKTQKRTITAKQAYGQIISYDPTGQLITKALGDKKAIEEFTAWLAKNHPKAKIEVMTDLSSEFIQWLIEIHGVEEFTSNPNNFSNFILNDKTGEAMAILRQVIQKVKIPANLQVLKDDEREALGKKILLEFTKIKIANIALQIREKWESEHPGVKWEEGDRKKGYVSVEHDPTIERRIRAIGEKEHWSEERIQQECVKAIMEEVRELSQIAPNITVKVRASRVSTLKKGVTKDKVKEYAKGYLGKKYNIEDLIKLYDDQIGLRVLLEATSEGINTNYTLTFLEEQLMISNCVVMEGRKIARETNKITRYIAARNNVFVSRFEKYTDDEKNAENIEGYLVNAHGLVGVIALNEAHNGLIEIFGGEQPQTLISASIGPKIKGMPKWGYYAFSIGGAFVITSPSEPLIGYNMAEDLEVAANIRLPMEEFLTKFLVTTGLEKDKEKAESRAEAAIKEWKRFSEDKDRFNHMKKGLDVVGDDAFETPFIQARNELLKSVKASPTGTLADNWHLAINSSTQSVTFTIIDGNKDEIVCMHQEKYVDPYYERFGAPDGHLERLNAKDPNLFHTDPIMVAAALDRGMLMLKQKVEAKGGSMANIRAISGAGQQHGTVYLNKIARERLKNLNPALLLENQLKGIFSRETAPIWRDKTTDKEAAQIEELFGGAKKTMELTGSRAALRFSYDQILKFYNECAESDSTAYDETDTILNIAAYNGALLTGNARFPWDYSDAAGTNAMDIRNKTWLPQIDKLTPGVRQKLTELRPSNEIIGTIAPYWTKYGLSEDTVVVNWVGDNPSSMTGQGIIKPGPISISLGTSFTLFRYLNKGDLEKAFTISGQHVFMEPTGKYMQLVCFQNGGLALRDIRDKYIKNEEAGEIFQTRHSRKADMSVKEDKDEISAIKWEIFRKLVSDAKCPAGNNGAMMITQNTQEEVVRIPFEKGEFFTFNRNLTDLSMGNRAQILRAAAEGQIYFLKWIADQLGLKVTEINLTGGVSRDSVIRQIIADIFNADVRVLEEGKEPVSMGSAIRARKAYYDSKHKKKLPWNKAVKKLTDIKEVIKPIPDNVKTYQTYYPKFASMAEGAIATKASPTGEVTIESGIGDITIDTDAFLKLTNENQTVKELTDKLLEGIASRVRSDKSNTYFENLDKIEINKQVFYGSGYGVARDGFNYINLRIKAPNTKDVCVLLGRMAVITKPFADKLIAVVIGNEPQDIKIGILTGLSKPDVLIDFIKTEVKSCAPMWSDCDESDILKTATLIREFRPYYTDPRKPAYTDDPLKVSDSRWEYRSNLIYLINHLTGPVKASPPRGVAEGGIVDNVSFEEQVRRLQDYIERKQLMKAQKENQPEHVGPVEPLIYDADRKEIFLDLSHSYTQDADIAELAYMGLTYLRGLSVSDTNVMHLDSLYGELPRCVCLEGRDTRLAAEQMHLFIKALPFGIQRDSPVRHPKYGIHPTNEFLVVYDDGMARWISEADRSKVDELGQLYKPPLKTSPTGTLLDHITLGQVTGLDIADDGVLANYLSLLQGRLNRENALGGITQEKLMLEATRDYDKILLALGPFKEQEEITVLLLVEDKEVDKVTVLKLGSNAGFYNIEDITDKKRFEKFVAEYVIRSLPGPFRLKYEEAIARMGKWLESAIKTSPTGNTAELSAGYRNIVYSTKENDYATGPVLTNAEELREILAALESNRHTDITRIEKIIGAIQFENIRGGSIEWINPAETSPRRFALESKKGDRFLLSPEEMLEGLKNIEPAKSLFNAKVALMVKESTAFEDMIGDFAFEDLNLLLKELAASSETALTSENITGILTRISPHDFTYLNDFETIGKNQGVLLSVATPKRGDIKVVVTRNNAGNRVECRFATTKTQQMALDSAMKTYAALTTERSEELIQRAINAMEVVIQIASSVVKASPTGTAYVQIGPADIKLLSEVSAAAEAISTSDWDYTEFLKKFDLVQPAGVVLANIPADKAGEERMKAVKAQTEAILYSEKLQPLSVEAGNIVTDEIEVVQDMGDGTEIEYLPISPTQAILMQQAKGTYVPVAADKIVEEAIKKIQAERRGMLFDIDALGFLHKRADGSVAFIPNDKAIRAISILNNINGLKTSDNKQRYYISVYSHKYSVEQMKEYLGALAVPFADSFINTPTVAEAINTIIQEQKIAPENIAVTLSEATANNPDIVGKLTENLAKAVKFVMVKTPAPGTNFASYKAMLITTLRLLEGTLSQPEIERLRHDIEIAPGIRPLDIEPESDRKEVEAISNMQAAIKA